MNKGGFENNVMRLHTNLKLVVSGNVCESYEFPNIISKRKKKKRPMLKATLEERIAMYHEKGDYEKNYRTAKKNIERLIHCNPQLNKFLTLTFKNNQKDLSIANACFHDFIFRLRKSCPEFQYICLPEFQKRGAVHYHLLCSLPYMESKKIEKIWGYGFIKIRRTEAVKSLAKYMTKYLTKTLFDGRLFGKKKFFCSQNLIRPTVLRNDEALEFIQNKNLEKVFEAEYPVPFLGWTMYTLYENQEA